MLYFWNPDDSLTPNMMIDTSPWSFCSRRSPWSPWSTWLPCSIHTFSSTGPSVSPFRDFCVLIYKFETFCDVSIHHLTYLVQKLLQNKKKQFFWTPYWVQSCCIQMWPLWQLKTWPDQQGERDKEIMTHLTIPGNLRDSNYTIEGLRLIW